MSGSEVHTRRSQVSGTLVAVMLTIAGALPTFLTSALAVQLQDDLSFGPGALGLATSVSFGVAGASSRPMGRLVQRHGSRFGFLLALTLSSASLVIVLAAPTYAVLLGALVVAGFGNAAAQPTANLMITEFVGRRRLGLAMGIKQSYIPIASLLGGIAVPTVAVQYGWRWAIAGAVGFCVLAAILGWRRHRGLSAQEAPANEVEAAASSSPTLSRRGLLLLTLGGGLAAGSATALGVFLVDSAVTSGVDPSVAGYLLAVCAASCLVCRVTAGWLADRIAGRSLYVASVNIMAATVVGMVLLAFGGGWVFIVGAVLGYVGWSWPGLFHLAIVRDSQGNVAAATGTVQTGFSGGAAFGPVIIGLLVETYSYQTAWLFTAVIAVAGIVVTRWGRRVVRRDRGLPTSGRRTVAPRTEATRS